ncbi:MAG TPA: methyltransferase domain-containing protein [Verrucomicrobiae bacterium]|nr:methyltransferase domain-containing protein [Verrucomicrobiae bacterium]
MIVAESYTVGYQREAVDFVGRRRASTHAAFLLPHLKPGMRLLDCGCGPGTITVDLARMVAPAAVVGVDREASQVEMAAERAHAHGAINTHFKTASIYDLPFGENEFDVVFAHALFEHLKEPAKALREAWRVLRPGGLLALRSPDWGGFLLSPERADVRSALEYFKAMQLYHGGDVFVGRKMKGLLSHAGFKNIATTASYETCEPLAYFTDFLAARIETSLTRDHAVARGWSTEERVQQMISGLRQFGKEPTAFFALSWCEVIGVR